MLGRISWPTRSAADGCTLDLNSGLASDRLATRQLCSCTDWIWSPGGFSHPGSTFGLGVRRVGYVAIRLLSQK
jgi:hypothetical protein